MTSAQITTLLGPLAEGLLSYQCSTISADQIEKPSWSKLQKTFAQSDRPAAVQKNLKKLYHHGRLAGTGYLSILPVDQGIEHTAAYSFVNNPIYFRPESIAQLAIEGGCNGLATSLGVAGLISQKYAAKIPLIVKLNHHELLSQPVKAEQHIFAQVEQAYNLGAIGVGATIYFGSADSPRQITEIGRAFAVAHQLGLLTILWCYPRSSAFQTDQQNYEAAADISGQAVYLGVNLEADIIKQKMPTMADGLRQLKLAKFSDQVYDQLIGHNPIDWVRFQVLNCFGGQISLLNSGGESQADDDLVTAVTQAVINKRAGGSGLIMGRKAFSHPLKKGIEILQAVQDVYLASEITLA